MATEIEMNPVQIVVNQSMADLRQKVCDSGPVRRIPAQRPRESGRACDREVPPATDYRTQADWLTAQVSTPKEVLAGSKARRPDPEIGTGAPES